MKKIILFILITILITIYFLNKKYNISDINDNFLEDNNLNKLNNDILEKNNKNKNNNKDDILKLNNYVDSNVNSNIDCNINQNFINKLLFIYLIIKKNSIKTDEDLSNYMINNLYKNQKYYDYYCINKINENFKEELDNKLLYDNIDKTINDTLSFEKIKTFLDILEVDKYIKNIFEKEKNLEYLNDIIKDNPDKLFYLDKITDETINNLFKNKDMNSFESNFINDKLILNKFMIINYDNNYIIKLNDITNLLLLIINCYYYNKPIIIHIYSDIKYESGYVENIFKYLLEEINSYYGMYIRDNNNLDNKISTFLSKFELYYSNKDINKIINKEKIKKD